MTDPRVAVLPPGDVQQAGTQAAVYLGAPAPAQPQAQPPRVQVQVEPDYIAFARSREWEWYTLDVLNIVVPPRATVRIKEVVGAGYLYAAGAIVSSPNLLFWPEAESPNGVATMRFSASWLANAGISSPNAATPFLALSNASNNTYSMVFAPGFPGFPFNSRSRLLAYNPGNASATIYEAWGLFILLRGSYVV